MMSLPIGGIITVCVLIFALLGAKFQIFLNSHSLVLVVGGTIGVLGLSTPFREIKQLIRTIRDLKKPAPDLSILHSDLSLISDDREARAKSGHPLIVYAQDLWEKGVDSQMLMALMGRKMEELNSSTEQAVATIRNLAKYPPALGMMGTVIGLVSLFSNLTPENRTSLGPLLALAMTATFYGLVLANVVLMPLADRLYVMHLSEVKTNEHVFKVLLLIHQNEARKVIEDELYEASA